MKKPSDKSSLSYTILVTKGNYSHQASYTAYRFVQAVLDKGHQIKQIFFYQDGVYNASAFVQTPDDEINLSKQWQILIQKYQIKCTACSTAALRRGIIDETEAQKRNISSANLANHVDSHGLSQLMEAICLSDRFIQFGS